MRRRILLPVVLALVASIFPPPAFARQRDPARPQTLPGRDTPASPSTGTATISGVVMSDESNPRPVRRAAITLTASSDFGGRMALTDDSGRFVIGGLPAGRFTMMTSKPGWVSNYYGARTRSMTPGTTIVLADGQKVTLDVRLLRGAVIAGRVVDQNGVPQTGARISLLEMRTLGGERVVVPANLTMMSPGGTSDDRGEFRIYGLPPGSYIVSAAPPSAANAAARLTTADEVQWALRAGTAGTPVAAPPLGRMVGYAPVYYPGTADVSAAVSVTVGDGEERRAIDFPLPLVAMSRVAGTLTRHDGLPVQGGQVMLATANAAIMAPGMDQLQSRASVDAQGRFTFASVRPGQYKLIARAPSQAPVRPQVPNPRPVSGMAGLDLYAQAELAIAGQDLEDLSLTLQPGSTISGRIVFEATTLAVPTDLSRAFLQLTPPTIAGMLKMSNIDQYSAPTNPDGTFAITGLAPGTYALNARFSPADAWMVKSIQSRGRDVSDAAIEVGAGADVSDVVITFTDRTSEVSGTIFDANGKATGGYYVFLFPVDRFGWTPMSRRFRPPSQPSTDGKYRVPGLPPGDYYVTALTELDPLNVLDENFLQQLTSAAFKITLRDGEKKVQDIRIK